MLKRRILINLLVIVMAFSFTSCINIVEKVFFKKNGSGTYTMTLDMSKVANMLTMFGEDEMTEMEDAMNGMNEGFEQAKAKLEGVTGISNINQEMDKKTLTYTMAFDFRDVDALNDGLNRYFANEDDNGEYTYFTSKKKQFTRTSMDRFSKALNEEMASSEDSHFDPAILMGDAYFESILIFEKDIKSHSNTDYKKDGNRKISLKKFFFNKISEGKSLAVTVKTK
ncbi:MAG: hypothetical protein HEP71_09860 [Roseivirga sp.]|nr:hypothetical protein [Roseivirga sp.]